MYTLHVTLQPVWFTFVAGFLGFREAPAIVEAFSKLRDTNTNLVPECILVDGNGILHPRGFGLASHVGELKCCIANGECRCFCVCVALTAVLQTGSSCEIGSFHSDVAKYSSLLAFDAVLLASSSWHVNGLYCLFMHGIIPVKISSKCDSKLYFSNCSWCFVSQQL